MSVNLQVFIGWLPDILYSLDGQQGCDDAPRRDRAQHYRVVCVYICCYVYYRHALDLELVQAVDLAECFMRWSCVEGKAA